MPGSDRPNVLKVAQAGCHHREPGAWPTIPALTRLMSARRPSNPSLPKRNRSLVTPPVKFRILKIHAAETRPGKRPPRWEAPDFPRQRPAHCPLTRGNVGGPHTAGNDGAETALVGGRQDSNLGMAESNSTLISRIILKN